MNNVDPKTLWSQTVERLRSEGVAVERVAFAGWLAVQTMDVDYDNFKDSVDDDQLHVAYMKVWSTMEKLQA